MLAFRQIIEDPQEVIAIPPEFRHRRTEVIFIALDSLPEQATPADKNQTLTSLAGCCEGEMPKCAPQGDDETHRKVG